MNVVSSVLTVMCLFLSLSVLIQLNVMHRLLNICVINFFVGVAFKVFLMKTLQNINYPEVCSKDNFFKMGDMKRLWFCCLT